MKAPKMNITQDEKNPVEKNILAAAIVAMSDGVKRLESQGLTFEAIIILTLHNIPSKHRTGGIGQRDVEAVLRSLGELKTRFVH